MTQKAKILIAEDELSFAEVLSAYFNEKGYEVSLAVSGERCLELVREVKPHVLLLDLRFEMGFITGEEIIEQIQRLDSSLQIIVMTGYNAPETEQKIRKLGIFDFLRKPVALGELSQKVAEAVKKRPPLQP